MPLAAGARPKKENPAGFRCRFYCKATHPDPFVSPNAMPYYDGAAGDFLLVHRSWPRRLPPGRVDPNACQVGTPVLADCRVLLD